MTNASAGEEMFPKEKWAASQKKGVEAETAGARPGHSFTSAQRKAVQSGASELELMLIIHESVFVNSLIH